MSRKKVAGAAATAPATELESGCQPSFPMSILTEQGAVVNPSDVTICGPADSRTELSKTPILPTHLLADVKVLLELKDRNVPNIDIVDTVRTIFPGFDSPLLSKCRNPRTGIMLRPPAVRLLREHFKITEARDSHRKPARKKPKRIQCRLTDAVYRALQRRISQTGRNVQDYLEGLILKDLEEAGLL